MKIGDCLLDNDPRIPHTRRLEIVRIDETHVKAKTTADRYVTIRKDRIYSDGKPRKTGFTLQEKK